MWRSRMLWRLFITYGLLILCSLVVVGWVIVDRVQRQYLGQIEDGLRTKAVLVREVVRGRPVEDAPRLQEQVLALRQEIATRITLIADDGRVLADSEDNPAAMENHGDRPEVRAARAGRFGSATRFSGTLHKPMMYVALRTDDPEGAVAIVRVALPLDRVNRQLDALQGVVAGAAALTGLAALALAFWLARRTTLPLRELTAAAERIRAGQYDQKVYVTGRDEVGALARAFNRMSERLAAQFTQLAEDREQLRMILGGMVEGVVALDASQRILFANERALHLLGVSNQAVAGRRLWEVVRHRPLQELVRRALAGPKPCQEELAWNGPGVKSLTVHAARLTGPPPRGAVLVLHDTTELRRLERLRQEFVANVSHELKTPLSVIKACVETLLDGAADDPEHRGPFLQRIAEQGDRLHALIIDLISLARIESGEEVFELEAVPLGPAVAACLERHRARAEAKNQRLEALPAPPADGPGAEAAAWADEEAVAQILDNLVDNAVKYTPPGGRIRVRWGADDGHVQLEVEDTGIGIPENDLPRIFERFYRVDKARSRELGGTGLGLSIVKHLVQAMRGNIRAGSRVGHGTTFTVRLPRAPLV
jgi:two-component system phosphate regulon sensor histidine kinase PhoR